MWRPKVASPTRQRERDGKHQDSGDEETRKNAQRGESLRAPAFRVEAVSRPEFGMRFRCRRCGAATAWLPETGRRKDFANPPSEAMRSRGQTEPPGERSAVLGRKREYATERSRKGALVIPPGRRPSRRREGIPPGERAEDGGEALGRDFSIFRFFDSSIELGQ